MGFDLDKTQYQVTRHTDSENDHIHILANRVMFDGQVLSDKNDFKLSHEATRAAEKAASEEGAQGTSEEEGRAEKESYGEEKSLTFDDYDVVAIAITCQSTRHSQSRDNLQPRYIRIDEPVWCDFVRMIRCEMWRCDEQCFGRWRNPATALGAFEGK